MDVGRGVLHIQYLTALYPPPSLVEMFFLVIIQWKKLVIYVDYFIVRKDMYRLDRQELASDINCFESHESSFSRKYDISIIFCNQEQFMKCYRKGFPFNEQIHVFKRFIWRIIFIRGSDSQYKIHHTAKFLRKGQVADTKFNTKQSLTDVIYYAKIK